MFERQGNRAGSIRPEERGDKEQTSGQKQERPYHVSNAAAARCCKWQTSIGDPAFAIGVVVKSEIQ